MVALSAAGGVGFGWIAHWARARSSRNASSAPPGSQDERPMRPTESEVVARPVSSSGRVESGVSLSEGATAAGRIILHLAALGRLGSDDVASVGFTQGGMIDSLGIRQGTLTKVISRLEAAGVLESDTRHVSGRPRRLKVYRLTGRGESVARDLRHPSLRPTTAGAGSTK
ncbi:MAG: PadR family transcriptional regulator [Thermoplasmata archaeon]